MLSPLSFSLFLYIFNSFFSSYFSSICFHSFFFSHSKKMLDINGEGNGTPLQYSCLENPMDGGAWWAAVHGVARSRTQLSVFTFMHWRRQWQPTPVFLPGESQGQRSLVGCCLWGCTESDTTEATLQQQQLYIKWHAMNTLHNPDLSDLWPLTRSRKNVIC